MYGLPADVDLKFFEGKELEQVCVGRYQFQLHFSGGNISISVQSRFTHRAKGKVSVWAEGKPPISASSVLTLLGSSVVAVKWKTDGTLVLKFSNHDTVTIFDDDPNYEAYTIHHGGDLFIV